MEKLKELVNQFRYNLKDYTSWNFNETNTRQQFIDKFFELLGWDVNNHFWRSEQYKEVVLEDKLKINWQAKAPDYSFRLWGRRIFFVEAKKPSVNIKDDVEPAYQIRRYSWTAKLPIGILTDFEELEIYDTRVKPNPTDKAGTARIKYFSFEELEENREWIYNTLSKEAVEKWALDKYIQEGKKKWTQSVDVDFLNMIDDRRDALAKNIYLRYGNERNRDLDRLNNIVGDIVDKIIFLRIAEDKKIENSWNLETIANGKEIWKHLISYFEASDKKYNSWLFDNTEIFKKFELDDKILKQILLSLYYPACPYEFSVLGVDILGNIYEKFLGKTLVKEWRTIKTEFKPDVKKAGWVFYTPQYIVDYIVKNTVWELLKWKTPKQALELNIVDPACGSGAFLIGAYDYILNRFLEQHTLNDETIKKSIKEGKIYQFKSGYHLSFAYKKEILKNMIYGVDIDRQAVAVSRLSLLLKLLEWETAETANQLFSTIDAALLPKLDNNIKCGNSLIDNSIYANLASPDEATIKKINAFNWEKEFAEVFVKWGFDAVIGNPPYFNVQTLWAKSVIVDYLKNRYSEIRMDKSDILFYFIWKAISISKWKVSFIVSNAFLNWDKAQKLRKYILDNSHIEEIINFEKYQIFDSASITTCIFKLKAKVPNKETIFLNFTEKTYSPMEISETIDNKKKYEKTKFNLWEKYVLVDKGARDLLGKIDKEKNRLRDLFKIWKWMETACNEVFLFSDYPNKFPTEFIRRRMSWEIIDRYYLGKEKEYLLYFESIENFDDLPIEIQKHLELNKTLLKNRATVKNEWRPRWKYSRPMHKEFYGYDKIWCSYRSPSNKFVYDNSWDYVWLTNTTVIFWTNENMHLKFLLWLLNSKLLTFRYRFIGKQTGWWIFEYFENWVWELPIPTVSESQQKPIIELVDQILLAQKKLKETEFDDDKKVIQKQIEIIDGKIDDLVFDLYGLSEEERKVVEGK